MSEHGPTDENVDIAVVGAGVGGCYMAFRLMTAHHGHGRPKVALYECDDRVGGRLWSPRLSSLDGDRADVGAMRFDPEIRLISDLIEHMGLTADTEPFYDWRPENLIYVNGTRKRFGSQTASDPLTAAAERAVPEFDRLRRAHAEARSRQDWDSVAVTVQEYRRRSASAQVKGAALSSLDLPGMLRHLLGDESVKSIEAANGYSCDRFAGNAATWLDSLFFTPHDVDFRRIKGGFQRLASRLHVRYARAGGITRLGTRLVGIERLDRGPGAPPYELFFETSDGEPRRVTARKVILTVPQRPLQSLIAHNRLLQDSRFITAASAVRAVPAAKLIVVYPHAWWRALGIDRGRSTTDLPLRQSWYVGDGKHDDRPAALLAAYPSGDSVGYWQDLAGDTRQNLAAIPQPASPSMVDAAQRQLARMHGLPHLPDPVESLWHDWSAKPWHGGWHVWREGYHPEEVIPYIRHPFPQEQVFVVSECWSHDQGSVQGAVAVAECVAQDHFGLDWPAWLRRDGTRLGPRAAAFTKDRVK